jgi:F420-non-reducing hydrogenase small subunit
VQRIRRFVKNARYQPDKPISEMRCLLDQGFLCMGPVTLAGCAGMNAGSPRCIKARVPCRGCHGPVRKGGNQIMDMLNALVSNGIDTKNLPDRLSLLRFSGAHGRLNRRSV